MSDTPSTTFVDDGIHPGVSFETYLAHAAFSSSDLRTFRQGPPAMVPWRREHRDDGVTDATRIGSAAHCGILQPSEFEQRFVLKPEGLEFRSKEAKEQRDAWLAAGKTILSHDEGQQIADIVRAFLLKTTARESLAAAAFVEASMLWHDPLTGLRCKGRPDWFDDQAVYDLKVSVEGEKSLDQIRFRAHANGWMHQVAHYRSGLRRLGRASVKLGRLVIVAPRPPQECRVWLLELGEDAMDHLELANEMVRKQIAECVRSGIWPGTPETWEQIELPAPAVFVEDFDAAEEVIDV